jgi:hypothetical protein
LVKNRSALTELIGSNEHDWANILAFSLIEGLFMTSGTLVLSIGPVLAAALLTRSFAARHVWGCLFPHDWLYEDRLRGRPQAWRRRRRA